MEYFQRNKEQSEKLKNEIRNIECAVKNIYKDQEERCQNSEVIRLHETTLSGEELIAFVNCYLKGNITMSEINILELPHQWELTNQLILQMRSQN